jgi:predicted nuclease of predicted toxin-antitoxin system
MARFLVDASLPRSTSELVLRHKHEAVDVRDIGLGGAPDAAVARHAREHSMALITADFDFGDIRVYPPADYLGIVIVDRPDEARVSEVLGMIEKLLLQPEIVAYLPGRLAIVEAHRIRLRPA